MWHPASRFTPCAQCKALGCPQRASCPGGLGVSCLGQALLSWTDALPKYKTIAWGHRQVTLQAQPSTCCSGARGRFLRSTSRDALPVLQGPRHVGVHACLGVLDLSFSGCRKVEKEGGGGGEEGTKPQSHVHWLLKDANGSVHCPGLSPLWLFLVHGQGRGRR